MAASQSVPPTQTITDQCRGGRTIADTDKGRKLPDGVRERLSAVGRFSARLRPGSGIVEARCLSAHHLDTGSG